MLTNDAHHYGLISKLLHWLIALMILTLIAVGIYMTGLDKEDPTRGQIYSLHKAFGVTVLGLAVLRILWVRLSQPPELPAGLQDWEKTLSKLVKGLMYLLMLAVPLAGYLLSNSAGKPVSYFGLFELPAVVGKNSDWAEVFGEVHEIFAFVLLGLVGLHLAGALKHRFLDKRPDVDVLKRML